MAVLGSLNDCTDFTLDLIAGLTRQNSAIDDEFALGGYDIVGDAPRDLRD
jgi:hypothetical protein